MRAVLLAAGLAAFLAGPALAIGADELLPDAAAEARARAITAELRCVVCQNQSIDESDAPLARDLRLLVRERITAGDADGAVRDFVVRRYGEFVLLKPVFGPHTALLWLGPFLVCAAAFGGMLALRRRRAVAPPPLSPDEARRLAALTDGVDPGSGARS